MEAKELESSSIPPATGLDGQGSGAPTTSTENASSSKLFSGSKSFGVQESSNQDIASEKPGLFRFRSGIGSRTSPRYQQQSGTSDETPTAEQGGALGSLTKGLMDASKNAVKAVQVTTRHMVSQNKRRYQEGGFDLDMTYITDNIIAMGFPAGDSSSGLLGFFEGFYRNHMEEVITFFETKHKGKYKVYNLCSERLYDASLFDGKVACFPIDDHNCPPLHLITLFCKSAYTWLKANVENVIVVHCKAGLARTGMMISSLLLYLKYCPTAEEAIAFYNEQRCTDGKGLVRPCQIRYVKYFEHILKYFEGENQPPRRCMLRGFRLHKCPYWIRPSITVSDHNGVLFSTKEHPSTKESAPKDIWFSAPKNGVMVFALPGEPGLTELAGDFKVHFHDRQGDFYCWLNTTMMENRFTLNSDDLDDFDKRKLRSPEFQVEVVLSDYGSNWPYAPASPGTEDTKPDGDADAGTVPPAGYGESQPTDAGTNGEHTTGMVQREIDSTRNEIGDFSSDRKVEDNRLESTDVKIPTDVDVPNHAMETSEAASAVLKDESSLMQGVKKVSLKEEVLPKHPAPAAAPSEAVSSSASEFKPMAADDSVFSVGDEEDYEDD